MQLEHKIALVTGGGSGIGRAIAQRFAAEGATVVVNDLTLDSAKATVDSLPEGAPAGHPVAADVSDSAQVRAMFDEIEAAHGRLDVLVNNAGIMTAHGDGTEAFFVEAAAELQPPPQLITFMEDAGWHAILKVHLDGAFAARQSS